MRVKERNWGEGECGEWGEGGGVGVRRGSGGEGGGVG